MNVRSVFVGMLVFTWCVSSNAGTVNTGQFQLPLDMGKVWSCSPKLGYTKDKPWGQPHLNFGGLTEGPDVNKYHPGEDWNGWCDDYGDPVYSIADGMVYAVVDSTTDPSALKWVTVTHRLPDGKQIRINYLHLSKTSVVVGNPVAKGEKIGEIGNSGHSTGAHLMWEIHTDLNYTPHGYVAPLTITTALEHTSPTLFVSDRTDMVTYGVGAYQWSVFTMSGNAPSSTAYVEYQGVRVSLQIAMDLGWIQGRVWQYYGVGGWGYSPLNQLFFFDTNTYAWMPLLNGVTLNILRPLNTADNQADRAKADMIREASKDPRFVSVKTETYYGPKTYVGWGGDVAELHSMEFGLSRGGTWTMYQMTTKQNPLSRLVIYPNLDTGQFGNWTNVDLNTLY